MKYTINDISGNFEKRTISENSLEEAIRWYCQLSYDDLNSGDGFWLEVTDDKNIKTYKVIYRVKEWWEIQQ